VFEVVLPLAPAIPAQAASGRVTPAAR